jgi:hypothetical protein
MSTENLPDLENLICDIENSNKIILERESQLKELLVEMNYINNLIENYKE